MVVGWMRVGFVHGVMNTDNMSVLGLTIDYGPYGWLDDFDPHWTPNTTDAQGRRYRYAQQPAVAQWNLMRLAEAVAPLFVAGGDAAAGVEEGAAVDERPLHAALERYAAVYSAEYEAMVAAKFGLPALDDQGRELAREGFGLLYGAEMDYTLTFRALGELPDALPADDAALVALLGDVFYDEAKRAARQGALAAWLRRWHAVAAERGGPAEARQARMRRANPRYVLRNYLAQEAIDRAAAGDPAGVYELLDVMRRPYDDQPGRESFARRRPEWARHKAGCSMLSCSS
jgi:uncharacterized protein YdiU (UPF0061 family)